MPKHILNSQYLKSLDEKAIDVLKVSKAAKAAVTEMLVDSSSVLQDKKHTFPKFSIQELQIPKKPLGVGGFSSVFEIEKIDFNDQSISFSHLSGDEYNQDSRAFMEEHCLRNGEARYAIKKLSKKTKKSEELFARGIADLAVESRFLSSNVHPNIIKLRAVADVDTYDGNFFLVMDRLYDTLETRMEKYWKKTLKKASGLFRKKNDPELAELYQVQIQTAYDLAAALNYLHKRNIVYRDLKPENIGFDVREDVKLFDFGLIKELSLKDQVGDTDDYRLTHRTGSLRYMAPENALGKPYGTKSDVYGYSLLLWQILTCKKPFEVFFPGAMDDMIFSGPKKRPAVDKKWSTSLKDLIQKGWSDDPTQRPSMSEVYVGLRVELMQAGQEQSMRLNHSRRRSTFVFSSSGIPGSSRHGTRTKLQQQLSQYDTEPTERSVLPVDS